MVCVDNDIIHCNHTKSHMHMPNQGGGLWLLSCHFFNWVIQQFDTVDWNQLDGNCWCLHSKVISSNKVDSILNRFVSCWCGDTLNSSEHKTKLLRADTSGLCCEPLKQLGAHWSGCVHT